MTNTHIREPLPGTADSNPCVPVMTRKQTAVCAFKNRTVPVLRQNGFVGSFPHFRRIRADQIDLLSVQFDRYGGGYRLCVSRCPTHDIKDILGNGVEPGKTTAWHFGDRYVSDWLRYDRTSDGEIHSVAERLSVEAVAFLDIAQQYWEGRIVQRQSRFALLRYTILAILNKRL